MHPSPLPLPVFCPSLMRSSLQAMALGEPVVFTHTAVTQWPVLKRWSSASYLRAHLPQTLRNVHLHRYPKSTSASASTSAASSSHELGAAPEFLYVADDRALCAQSDARRWLLQAEHSSSSSSSAAASAKLPRACVDPFVVLNLTREQWFERAATTSTASSPDFLYFTGALSVSRVGAMASELSDRELKWLKTAQDVNSNKAQVAAVAVSGLAVDSVNLWMGNTGVTATTHYGESKGEL
jgi:hypothetical protein